ncbi:hypothetical protein Glove_295g22 [Diversispora epigaea]|uniref:Uncharacterized protein n=1 Tax=Diversispora epigaea TaxID=1348612 RepID=A0A397I4U8_9GLOM|nr:hypothetical protein Glove_295g22 [Diversispora epigaea]
MNDSEIEKNVIPNIREAEEICLANKQNRKRRKLVSETDKEHETYCYQRELPRSKYIKTHDNNIN